MTNSDSVSAQQAMTQTQEKPPSSEDTVVIVGAGHAGVATAAGLRSHGWPGRILMLDEQIGLPYERPALSKEFLKGGASLNPLLIRKESFYVDKGIELVSEVQVVEIEPKEHRLKLSNGEELGYSALVLSTGAAPRQLPVPGTDLSGVFELKTLDDAMDLREALERGGRLVIIGAGYIGLEVAAAATQYDCDVTVVETASRAMNRTTCDEVAAHYQRLHQEHGVTFVFGATVQRLEGDERVTAVVTEGNKRLAADHVLVAIGVVPNQSLAEAAGIACNDGIVVDALGRTSVPDVYAVGDVTRFEALFDQTSQRLECIPNAQEQAERLSAFLSGAAPKPREVPWFWTVQHGKRLQSAGVRSPEDDVVIRGDVESDQFTVCYLRDGKLAAVDTVGTLKDFRAAKKLIAAHAELDTGLIRDPDIPLSQSLPKFVEVGI